MELAGVRVVMSAMGAVALFALSGAGYALVTWARYGRASVLRDPLLDCFLLEYDVHERHETHIAAPAAPTFAAAHEMNCHAPRSCVPSSPGASS